MSIIYEALKKTQGRHKIAVAGIIPPDIKKEPLKKTAKVPYLPVLGAVTIGFALILFISTKYQTKARTSMVAPMPIAPRPFAVSADLTEAVQVSPPLVSSQVFQEAARQEKFGPKLTVNGIVISQDGNIALINDQIIRTGDNIEGAQVERIEENRVVLSYEGREIALASK